MEILRAIACGQAEFRLRQAGHSEIPDEPPGRGQHRCQAYPPRFWNTPRHDPIEPSARIRPRHAVFAEILHLVDAHGPAHGLHLPRGGLEGIRPSERRRLVSRLVPLGEVIGHFQPILLPPDRAHLVEDLVHGRRAEGPRGGQFLVRVGHGKAVLVVLHHLGQRVARRDPAPEARHVHREDIALRFALDHPLRQRQPDAAALAEPRHDPAGRPVVAQARHRPHQRVAIGGEGEGAVDHRLDARPFEDRVTPIGEGDRVLDLVVIVGQQFMPEAPGRTAHGPGLAGLFVKADAEPPAFLAQVAFAARVHHMRMFHRALVDLRQIIRHKILVLHRVQRQVDPGHRAHFARPQAAGIDHVLGMDRALVGHHVPGAIGALPGLVHHAMCFDRGAPHARGLGIGMGRARGVEMPVERIVKPAQNAFDIGDRGNRLDLLRRKDLRLQPHEPVLGAFRLQHVEAFGRVGQRHAAHVMQPAGHACQRLQLAVEPDRVALQRGHVRIAIQRMKAARRVPGGSARQFRAFHQHHVRPAELGQVIKHRAADDAAPDHAYPSARLHRCLSQWTLCVRQPARARPCKSKSDMPSSSLQKYPRRRRCALSACVIPRTGALPAPPGHGNTSRRGPRKGLKEGRSRIDAAGGETLQAYSSLRTRNWVRRFC